MQSIEVKGTVSQVCEPDANGKKQTFIINTEGQHGKTIAVSCWLDKITPPEVDSIVTAHVNLSSREYNSKWYHDLICWKLEVIKAPESLGF